MDSLNHHPIIIRQLVEDRRVELRQASARRRLAGARPRLARHRPPER